MGYVRFSTCPHRTDDLMPLRASVPTDYVFRTPRIDRCIYTYFQAIYVYIHIHRIYIYMCMSQLCSHPIALCHPFLSDAAVGSIPLLWIVSRRRFRETGGYREWDKGGVLRFLN